MQRILLTVVLAASVVCFGGAPARAELAGKGEWRSLSGDGIGGTWTATLTRRGERIEGALALDGSNVFRGGTVSGTIDGANIVLGVMTEQGKVASFTGKLEGGEVKGEWTAALVQDHGVWFGTLGTAVAQ